MGFRNRLANNSDQGRKAVMAACLDVHAHSGRFRSAHRVSRSLGPLVKPADILAVANANSSDFNVTGQTVTLTDAGYAVAKHHPLPRQLSPAE